MTRSSIVTFVLSLCVAHHAMAQRVVENGMDPNAIGILDHMAANIGDLHALHFQVSTSNDALDRELGITVKHLAEHNVYVSGPDRMLVDSRGDIGHVGYWYNGSEAVYYSYTENNYGIMSAPPTIIEMIDSLHHGFGIDFPAGDFFYPTFTDDLIEHSERIVLRGRSTAEGVECYHIVATGKEQDMELWVATDATFRPVRYLIRNKSAAGTVSFEGIFSNWHINPDLPEAMFSFRPPPGATQLRILSRYEKPTMQ